MRIKANYRATTNRFEGASLPRLGVNPNNMSDTERREYMDRVGKLAVLGHRLYSAAPTHSSPWWNNFSDGYPARAGKSHGHGYGGFTFYESGEIELKDNCGGSPYSCRVRNAFENATHGIEITTWGDRPTLWTEDGRQLSRNDYRALRRYCAPHQIDRDMTSTCPTVLVDHELGIAVPLAYGEHGMTAYWPDERSYPVTWSSWLVTLENEETTKIMADALRLVCRYANTMNLVTDCSLLTREQRTAYAKEADRVKAEWATASRMLTYIAKSHDPKEISKKMMEDYTTRQLIAIAGIVSSLNIDISFTPSIAATGTRSQIKFSKSSKTFRMLREQLSEQYETKYLYTKPPAARSNWRLVEPNMD